MTLKDDLLRKGFFPDNLPPAFTTELIADYYLANPVRGYLSDARRTTRAAIYNASKRGLTRRTFSAVHPSTGYDLAEFVSSRWDEITDFFGVPSIGFSLPLHDGTGDRAITINSHASLEREKLRRLSGYRFVACTDIARFYHSVYTHSLPWAFHGKSVSKADRRPQSAQVFLNRADWIFRSGQDGQTIGLPVGPDASRVFAEIIASAIDRSFEQNLDGLDCTTLRHVDDIWIGAKTQSDAERALSRYREAIREYELDINDGKTGIFSENLRFADYWPSEIASQIDTALNPGSLSRTLERLRATLENVFAYAASRGDDAVLKYVLRYLDQNRLNDVYWDAVEPFLKRVAVHFGHTIDYVARILVWRHLTHGDLDRDAWASVLNGILDQHGRLGNDSEVCWVLYTQHHLQLAAPNESAIRIANNCGALSVVALLNNQVQVSDSHDADTALVFETALDRLAGESAAGRLWPLFLEWKVKRWTGHTRLDVSDATIADLIEGGVHIYQPEILPPVFRDADPDEFDQVGSAIELRSSAYDDPVPPDEDDDLSIF
jgi:hypothetical protein